MLFHWKGCKNHDFQPSPKTSPNVCENVFEIRQISIKSRSGGLLENTTKTNAENNAIWTQNRPGGGGPRTWFSDPNAAKNNVLPACQLLFRHVLYFCVFSHFSWAPWNSSFTCMGAHFQRNVIPFVRFSCYLKCIWAGLWARWAPRPCPHSPKTLPNHDFCSFVSLLVWFVIDSWCIFPKIARRCWCSFLCFREWTFNETCKLNKQWTPFQKGTVAGLRAALLDYRWIIIEE